MLKKILFITLATGSMMIASAQTPATQNTPKAAPTAAKQAPAKVVDHKAKDTTQKAKAPAKQVTKKAQKDAKGAL